jgi:uncharacterized phage-associated protein
VVSLNVEASRPRLSAMPVSAHDVAAVLRARQPGMPVKKLHKLLYYCQGHHLAAFDEPLFTETVSAYDRGPVVGTLWHQEKYGQDRPAPSELDESQLNTIGYVLSRYGALSGTDLEHLTHGEQPWQLANATRMPGGQARIDRDWMRDYFRGDGAAGDDPDDPGPLDSDSVAALLAGAQARRGGPAEPDTWADIRRLIDGG